MLLFVLASLAWALGAVDPRALRAAFAAYRPGFLVPALLLFLGAFGVRTLRFRLLLDGEPGFLATLSVMSVGFLAIMVAPLRSGELVRPYLLREVHGIPLGRSVAAVVMERLLDVLGLLALLAAVGALVELPRRLVLGGVDVLAVALRTTSALVGAATLGLVVVAVLGPSAVDRLVSPFARLHPALGRALAGLGRTFIEGVRGLFRPPGRAVAALALTAAAWAGTLGSVAVVMAGFPGLPVDADHVLFHWAAIQSAILAVPTPGFLGAFEAGGIASLRLLGVEADLARAQTLLLHVLVFAFTVGLGLLAMVREGWPLLGVLRASQARETDASD